MRDRIEYWLGEPAGPEAWSPLIPSPAELRHAPRRDVEARVWLDAVGRSGRIQPLGARLQDVSWFGLGMRVVVPLEPGSCWRVRFPDATDEVDQLLLAIRYCRSGPGGAFAAGAQFCIAPGVLGWLGVRDWSGVAAG